MVLLLRALRPPHRLHHLLRPLRPLERPRRHLHQHWHAPRHAVPERQRRLVLPIRGCGHRRGHVGAQGTRRRHGDLLPGEPGRGPNTGPAARGRADGSVGVEGHAVVPGRVRSHRLGVHRLQPARNLAPADGHHRQSGGETTLAREFAE